LIQRTTNLAPSRGGIKFLNQKYYLYLRCFPDAFVWPTLKT